MTRLLRVTALIVTTVCATGTTAQTGRDGLDDLRPGVVAHGFRAEARYLDASDRPIGARFVHVRTGFVFDYLSIQTAPQAFIWVRTFPVSDRGEPHTQEHLLLLRGSRGRALGDLETMTLGVSSAFVSGWRTAYHFHTPAGPDVFYTLFDAYLDALLNPDYTDEEIRREVRNFGVTVDPEGSLRLEEKGTVYNEMVASFDRPTALPFRALQQAWYGTSHPLSWSAGGTPAAIREMEPAHIRRFHADHYHLGNMGMIGAYPAEMPLDDVLTRTDALLNRYQGASAPRGAPLHEDRLPAAQMAPAGEIRVVDYPHQNPQQPSALLVGWPPERRLDSRGQLLLDLFLSTVAGDATTNLYRLFIDGERREIETGARSITASASRDQGHPVSVVLMDASPALLTGVRVREVRERLLAELRSIAGFGDGSPELAEFNSRVRSRLVELRRAQGTFLDEPPGFGQRGTGTAWVALLHRLSAEPAFDRSLALRPELAFVDELLDSGRNVWRDHLTAWRLLDVSPYVVIARPSPDLLASERRERDERLEAEVRRLGALYGTTGAQETIRQYQADYDAESARLDALAAAGARPPFIDSPPMVLDPQLVYDVTDLAGGAPLVASTFPGMTGATAGLALRLDVVAEPDLLYLALLPRLLTDVGIIRDGQPMSVQEMRTAQRHEILDLRAYVSGNVRTGRAELVVRGSGSDAGEAALALGWMQDVLAAPDWRIDNLPRIRDVVDQALGQLRRTMQGAEEAWVNDPANAYRRQDEPLFLATQSVLTRTHAAHRLRWQLQALPDAGGEALMAFLRAFASAGGEGGRADLVALLQTMGGDAVQDRSITAPLRRHLSAFEALPPEARATAAAAARDLEVTLGDLPDGSLASDWQSLVDWIARDLEMPPARALDALHRVRRLVLNTGGARFFTIASPEGHQALRAPLQRLAGVLSRDAVPRAVYARERAIDARLAARDPDAAAPVFVGLVNPNTQGGVFLHSAPLVTLADTGREALLDYLASRLYGGGGSHGLFSKTVAAGLAYSNGLGGSPVSGRIVYYAERVPELPQTLRFVIEELRRAEPDTSLVDYAIAQAFIGSRSGARYEDRGEAMAADLADGQPAGDVRRFREAVLALRDDPGLAGELFTRLERVTGRVFPGYGPASASVEGGVYLVIGPERQLQVYEEYLRAAENGARLHRIYPRDFWLVR